MFVAVMESGSFAAAAQRLRLSSGQASKMINRLERDLGVQLLKRTTRALAATEMGQAYFERIRAIVAEIDALDQAMNAGTREPTGTLRITVAESFGVTRLLPLFLDFLERHPHIELEASFSDRMVNIVDDGFDAAIRVGAVSETSLIVRKLSERHIMTVASPAYLAAHGEPAHPSELAGHPCVLDTNFRDPRKWWFRDPTSGERMSVDVEGRLVTSSPEACLIAAERGFGIAHVPSFMPVKRIAAGTLVAILRSYEEPPLPISILYPPTRHLAPKMRSLIDFLVDKLRSAPTTA